MKKRDVLLKTILILSILGFLTSLYLVQNHYVPPTEGALCDFSEFVSCSLVNTSTYSILLGVPVAIFGTLWFLFLFLMALQSLKSSKKELSLLLLGWNVLGLLFVIYLVIAEIILQAICPLCTVVHVIILITLVLSILLYKKQKVKLPIKKLKPWIVWIIIINLIPLILFSIPAGEQEDYTELAKCITEKGVNMYGSFKCGICAKTRTMFGDAFQHINEIECHPQGDDSKWELCQEKEISGTPTWILEPEEKELKRQTGFLSIDNLKEFSGCNLE